MRQRHQDRTCRELTSSISPNVSRQRARNLAFKLNSPPSQDCVNNSGSRHHRFADIALPHRATRHLKHAVKALLGGQAEPLVHLDARLQVAQREIQLLHRRSEEHTSELQSLMRTS